MQGNKGDIYPPILGWRGAQSKGNPLVIASVNFQIYCEPKPKKKSCLFLHLALYLSLGVGQQARIQHLRLPVKGSTSYYWKQTFSQGSSMLPLSPVESSDGAQHDTRYHIGESMVLKRRQDLFLHT